MTRGALILCLALVHGVAARDVTFTEARTGAPLVPPQSAELVAKLTPLTEAGAISDAVLAHYQAHGHPVTEVEIDPATAAADPLAVRIHEGRFGTVAIEGNSSWMARALSGQTRRLVGQPLTMAEVSALLDWVHRNPFHAASIGFVPGAEPATAEATLSLRTDRLARAYAGWENNGVEPLSTHRFTAGFEAADVAGLPLWMNAEGFAGEDVDAFHGARGAVRLFLPWRHELRLAGSWTEGTIDGFLPGLRLTSDVTSWEIGARYVVPLRRWHGWQADVGAGVDFRRTESGVSVPGAIVEATADTGRVVLEFSGVREGETNRSGFVVSGLWCPGGFTENDSDAAHGTLRDGAEAQALIGRADLWTLQALPAQWELSARLGGQLAADPLLPADELSLVGSRTVRGFPEATVLADSAWWGSLELHAPAWSHPVLAHSLSVQPVGFLDAGQGRDLATHDGSDVASAGLGLRVRWGQSLALALDYAWRLTEPGSRAHLALQVAF